MVWGTFFEHAILEMKKKKKMVVHILFYEE